MTPKDPFSEGTFWDKFWRPIRSRALLFTPENPGALLGTAKETKTLVRHLLDPRFEANPRWLEVA